jgi:hypothetical protein
VAVNAGADTEGFEAGFEAGDKADAGFEAETVGAVVGFVDESDES